MKSKPKRRYLIETANADYWCDDYKISPFQGLNAISIDGGIVDAFTIYDAITAIHDYESKITLRKFALNIDLNYKFKYLSEVLIIGAYHERRLSIYWGCVA